MDTRSEIPESLTSRRAKITPGYYTRLERGNMSGVSESVLEAVLDVTG